MQRSEFDIYKTARILFALAVLPFPRLRPREYSLFILKSKQREGKRKQNTYVHAATSSQNIFEETGRNADALTSENAIFFVILPDISAYFNNSDGIFRIRSSAILRIVVSNNNFGRVFVEFCLLIREFVLLISPTLISILRFVMGT